MKPPCPSCGDLDTVETISSGHGNHCLTCNLVFTGERAEWDAWENRRAARFRVNAKGRALR